MTSIDLSFNPLFSCIITLYTLILLYFPQALRLSISPILISTLTLLLFLLRLGAVQRRQLSVTESDKAIQIQQNKRTHFGEASNSSFLTHVNKRVASQSAERGRFDPDPNQDFDVSFVEWDVRAPLKVIYEESEGEEEGEGDPNEKDAGQYPTRFGGLGRYPSLAMCYPETDSDSDSDSDSEGGFSVAGEWASPERFCFNWEEEDREGLLIEIALDSDDRKDMGSDSDAGSDFHVEEDNFDRD
ncbi:TRANSMEMBRANE PROTEIN [Salix purpurea]|uniref:TRANSMEMBRANE PROTEIN n=1 Tax=Salix purpurea TaxID=77065 RepID=A0A9Q0WM33_SALPP|nr:TRANSMEMBRANE PROTEIN [Salix purpurea]